MYWWIKGFLENRLIKTSVNGIYSSALPLRDGLPQGSSLSCTLFLCYVNDLSEFLKTQNRLAFADDIVIWQQDTDVEKAVENLNRELALLKCYCQRWRMQVNVERTVYTVFSNSYRVLERELTVLIGDSRLRRDCEPCYLGVTLDPRLNLHRHIVNTATKARSRLELLKILAGSGWGATLHSLRTIYLTYVRPVLEYASPVLTLANPSTLKKLDLVQNAAARYILGGLISTPIKVLERATAVEPLGLRRDAQCALARERFLRIPEASPLRAMSENPGRNQRLQKLSPLTRGKKISLEYDLSEQRLPPVPILWSPDMAPRPIKVELSIGLAGKKSELTPEVLKVAALARIDSYPKDYIQCYIDGSATEGTKNGGYGFTIKWPTDEADTDGFGPVGTSTCSYECEKSAFVKCVEALMEKHREGKQFPGVVILSDCQALLQVLGGQLSATISDFMMKVEELRTTGTEVLAQWIPSHVGVKGNEDADNLANQGREVEQPVMPASFADCKVAIRRGLAELWEAAFRDNDDNLLSDVRKLALRIRNPPDPIELLPRGEAEQVFRMRAEHTLLRGSMFRTKWTPQPSCCLCGFVIESTPHVLFSCPAL